MVSRAGDYEIIRVRASEALPSFAEEIRQGLKAEAKSLPCRFLYDDRGSELFDQICDQPEYYVTDCELEILETQDEVLSELVGQARTVVELGSGSERKAREILRRRQNEQKLTYVPIDISAGAINEAISKLTDEFSDIDYVALVGEYRAALSRLPAFARHPYLVLWFGSSIGNMDQVEAVDFLKTCRQELQEGDAFLLGTDLRKEAETIEPAYDDSAGVTAAFSLNLLERINREYEADFDLEGFRHVARYNRDRGRVEISIQSLKPQTVQVRKLDLTVNFSEGEPIQTEYAQKYSLEDVAKLADQSGFYVEQTLYDKRKLFALNLLRPRLD